MKKCLAVLLVAGLSLSMVACGGKEEKKAKATTAATTQATTEATTQAETQAETQAATEATTKAEETTAATTEATTEATTQAGASGTYAAVTTAADDKVEAYATQVQNAIIAYDWSQLGDMINFPISIDGNQVSNKDELINLLNDHIISPDFISAVGQPDVPKNLFANGQGICMADGNVWFYDTNFDGINQNGDPNFKILAINGIIGE